jgi:hypothetical protein
VPRFTLKSQAAILDLGMSGGSVERESKGDSRQRHAARFTVLMFGRRLAGTAQIKTGDSAENSIIMVSGSLSFLTKPESASPNSSDKG